MAEIPGTPEEIVVDEQLARIVELSEYLNDLHCPMLDDNSESSLYFTDGLTLGSSEFGNYEFVTQFLVTWSYYPDLDEPVLRLVYSTSALNPDHDSESVDDGHDAEQNIRGSEGAAIFIHPDENMSHMIRGGTFGEYTYPDDESCLGCYKDNAKMYVGFGLPSIRPDASGNFDIEDVPLRYYFKPNEQGNDITQDGEWLEDMERAFRSYSLAEIYEEAIRLLEYVQYLELQFKTQ